MGGYGNSLGLNPDISQKYKMGSIIKGVANTLHFSPPKNYKKNLCSNSTGNLLLTGTVTTLKYLVTIVTL
jgi:hypothetical protein